MRFSGSRGHAKFNLDGGLPRGGSTIIQAAKDPVRVPEDVTLVAIINRCLCRVSLGEDCYIVKGMNGDEETVPYGASVEKWTEVCERLLEKAVTMETQE